MLSKNNGVSPSSIWVCSKTFEIPAYTFVDSLKVYCTLKSEVERIWAQGKHVIFDIDVVGGIDIKRIYPERTLSVFVKPPSIEELKIRLKKRSTESEDKINMRVAKASIELATAPQFDFIIENNELDVALKEAEELAHNFLKKRI